MFSDSEPSSKTSRLVQPRLDYAMTPIWITHIHAMRASKDANLAIQFQADRANIMWIRQEIVPLMMNLADDIVMKRLQLNSYGVATEATPEQRANADLFFNLNVNMASCRTWYMMIYAEIPPEQCVGILSTSNQDSLRCMAAFRDSALLLIEADAAFKDPLHNDRIAIQLFWSNMSGAVWLGVWGNHRKTNENHRTQ